MCEVEVVKTGEQRQLSPFIRSVKELWNVSPIGLVAPGLGMLWFFVSLLMNFEVPSSGAVLVCVALISEFFKENSSLFHAASYVGYNVLKKEVINPTGPLHRDRELAYRIVGDTSSNVPNFIHPNATEELDSVKALAHQSDFYGVEEGSWNVRLTARRIKRRFSVINSAMAVAGTALWGYGDLIFKV